MKALFNITYGLFVLTAKTNKHSGCIINTLQQVTSSPDKISITINKNNHTTKMIEESGVFNVSILDMTTSFDIIKHFGFLSGKDVNKFENFADFEIADNGISYITKHTNSYLSAKVVSMFDVGSHITFVAEVTADVILSNTEPLTYAYYLNNIKPKPNTNKKRIYVCRICGYVYDGDPLPEDFICPICKHGASDFELKEETIMETNQTTNSSEEKLYVCPICGYSVKSSTPVETCVICNAKMEEK